MYQESFVESFGQNAPPLGVAFQNAHDPESASTQGIYSESANDDKYDQTNLSDQDGHDLSPGQNTQINHALANIESLINSNSYVAAAEEILKINIGSLPLNTFDRYKEALEQTVDGLHGQDTYLNAQLGTQSVTVIAISDAIEAVGISLDLFEKDGSETINSLNEALLEDGGFCLPMLDFIPMEEGGADQYNLQLHPDTGVLARYMANETISNSKNASLDHGGTAGQHVYSLDLKLGF